MSPIQKALVVIAIVILIACFALVIALVVDLTIFDGAEEILNEER